MEWIKIHKSQYDDMLRHYERQLEEEVYIFVHHGHNMEESELDDCIARQNKYRGCIHVLKEIKENYGE